MKAQAKAGTPLWAGLPSFIDSQVLGRDGAEDLLHVGQAAGDLQERGAPEVEQAGARGRVAELAGRPRVGDESAELAVDPQHLEDARPPGVARPEAHGTAPGAVEAAALAGPEPGADLFEGHGRLVQLE